MQRNNGDMIFLMSNCCNIRHVVLKARPRQHISNIFLIYEINITFPARVIVENIIPRNMIIAASVDNQFLGMIFSTITRAGNVIFI